ncbi:hypothetical protein GCM10010129_82310 [Streptomyces fumigatiscleroticus]|nr:hypothetical protein GCM10010129_82310 [Streptomyces fumigatiscleroticus]
MIAPVTLELLAGMFPAERITRVPFERQGGILTHGASRDFLAGTGVPRADGVLIDVRDDLADGLTPYLSHRPHADLSRYGDVPSDPARWLHLGTAFSSDIVLDGNTGTVYDVNAEVRAVLPLHTDLSSMVYGMWLLKHRRADYDPEELDGMLPVEESERIADEIQAELSRIDPLPFARAGWWEGVVTDIAGGMW